MKKIVVILCVLLSLFVFVSCPEPDNEPKPDNDQNRNGVVKILNSDLHYVGGESYLISGYTAGDEFGKEPGKEPGKKPGKKPGEEAYYGNNIPVSDGEYTVLDGAFEFLKEHGSLQLEIINERAGKRDQGESWAVRMTPYFNVTLKYDKNKTEYIIDNSNAVKDRVLEEKKYNLIINPKGEFLDELDKLYFNIDDDHAHAADKKITKLCYDDFFRFTGNFISGKTYEYYVMGVNKENFPVTEMKKISFMLPAENNASIWLEPELVSCAKVTVNNPAKGEAFVSFTMVPMNSDGTEKKDAYSWNSGVGKDQDSVFNYLDAGLYRFTCKNNFVVDVGDMPTIDIELKPNEIWTFDPIFKGTPEVKCTKVEK